MSTNDYKLSLLDADELVGEEEEETAKVVKEGEEEEEEKEEGVTL
ncbi:MAG: hypothetical protein Q7S45_00105 [Candidatus Curtissbacteria bacterium]|nr:hypothetical protein [Candidatus Curtissbacteria bacterium]